MVYKCKQVQRILQKLYDGKCTVTESVAKRDELTGETTITDIQSLTDIPCQLSYKGKNAAADDTKTSGFRIEQEIKLFLAPELKINPGARITVAQNGIVRSYKQAGINAVYPTHQEIELKLEDEYA